MKKLTYKSQQQTIANGQVVTKPFKGVLAYLVYMQANGVMTSQVVDTVKKTLQVRIYSQQANKWLANANNLIGPATAVYLNTEGRRRRAYYFAINRLSRRKERYSKDLSSSLRRRLLMKTS